MSHADAAYWQTYCRCGDPESHQMGRAPIPAPRYPSHDYCPLCGLSTYHWAGCANAAA